MCNLPYPNMKSFPQLRAAAGPQMNQQATLSSSLLAKFPVLESPGAAQARPAGAAAAVVALIVAAVMWTSEPKYKVLFSNLEDRDGGAIVTALGQMNVPYRYNENGTALLVPADRVYDARLQLASQGLPRGGSVGFELMDNARFGASQFAEQINYQRGLEGELARSIESMHTVQHARVHLAMPRQSCSCASARPHGLGAVEPVPRSQPERRPGVRHLLAGRFQRAGTDRRKRLRRRPERPPAVGSAGRRPRHGRRSAALRARDGTAHRRTHPDDPESPGRPRQRARPGQRRDGLRAPRGNLRGLPPQPGTRPGRDPQPADQRRHPARHRSGARRARRAVEPAARQRPGAHHQSAARRPVPARRRSSKAPSSRPAHRPPPAA